MKHCHKLIDFNRLEAMVVPASCGDVGVVVSQGLGMC
jgi:hypothetical protein